MQGLWPLQSLLQPSLELEVPQTDSSPNSPGLGRPHVGKSRRSTALIHRSHCHHSDGLQGLQGEALRDFRKVHQEGALDTSFVFLFPVSHPSPPSLNPCRPRRSSHLWEGSRDTHQLPSQAEPLLEGILETSLFSLGSPALKSGSSQLSTERHSGNDSHMWLSSQTPVLPFY